MKSRLTPYFINLIHDAALKSFWRKKALRVFLRECSVSDRYLASWDEDETKRAFLDRLFDKLRARDMGRVALVKMAEYLGEQRSFPDLQNWEDSELKIKEAHDAVSKLRVFLSKQENEINKETERQKHREEYRKRQEKLSRSKQSFQKLSDRLNQLGKNLGSQKAGYEFQDWFFNLLDFFEITNRRPYVSSGRQIDGSLTLSGTTYLVELKFTKDQANAPDIDTFLRKVTSKADNTMGIMVSMSGYSSIAIEEASGERTPLLLIDFKHLYLVLSGIMEIGDLINRIRRHASQTGEAYLSPDKFS